MSSSMFANAAVECVAKRQVTNPGYTPVYAQEILQSSVKTGSLKYVASTSIENCFFAAKSEDSEVFNLAVYQNSESSGSQSYGTFDRMGSMIASFTNSRVNLICQLECTKR
jgi:hypothetical protein